MNKIISRLKIFAGCMVEWFVFITSGILIICAIHFAASPDKGDIPRATLQQILLSALLTAFATAVFFSIETTKKSIVIILAVLHFCCLAGIMIVCGIHFGWIDYEVFGIEDMVVSVAVVYAFVIAVYYILDKKRAEQINRRLKEKYKDEDI